MLGRSQPNQPEQNHSHRSVHRNVQTAAKAACSKGVAYVTLLETALLQVHAAALWRCYRQACLVLLSQKREGAYGAEGGRMSENTRQAHGICGMGVPFFSSRLVHDLSSDDR